MALQVPIPQDIKHYGTRQLFQEILRRCLDFSINPAVSNVGFKVVGNDITIATAGNGYVLPNRSGTHTYRLIMEDNGAISADQIT